MAERQFRRVVTGLNARGESTVIFDEQMAPLSEFPAVMIWRSSIPADNSGNADAAVPFTRDSIESGHANFTLCRFAPNSPGGMHITGTIDYLVVISGRVTLVLEDGEADCGPGDCIVDRGVLHSWKNPHDEPCVVACVNLPAHPLATGKAAG